MKNILRHYHWCSSHYPSPGRPIEGLLQTKVKVMAAFDWLVLEVGVTAGSGCCHGWLSRTCVQWALGASWSCSLCTLLEGDKKVSEGQMGLYTIITICNNTSVVIKEIKTFSG